MSTRDEPSSSAASSPSSSSPSSSSPSSSSPSSSSPSSSGGGVGGALFRWRLAVIVGFFALAIVAGIAGGALRREGAPTVNGDDEAGVAWTAAALVEVPLQSLVGRDGAFFVCGVLSLVAFWLRAAGEARLGSAVYGQDAGPRVITGGPFRLLRHPLYAGTWLFFAATFAPWLPPLVLAVLSVGFALSLRAIAVYEEGTLAAAHGDAWSRYTASVPRFFGVPHRVDDDGVTTTARAWGLATLGNLALLSLGAYRILVSAGVMFRGLKALSLLCLLVWIVAVLVRRVLRR